MNTETLIILANSYAAHVGHRLSTVGAYAVNDGKFFDRLAHGRSCTIKTAERVLAYFDANWPSDLAWPVDVPRPSKTRRAA